jgi:hypothetical protein
MSKGFLIFVENSKSCDYVTQAYALALSIKNTQSTVSNISIVTNDKIPKNQQGVFDQIISVPWVSENVVSTYKAEHRWKLFHVTPYDETIVLDADMLFLDDVTDWWDYCSNHDLKFCSTIKNYKREPVLKDIVHRRAFIDNNLTNPYFALHYFKKSDKALEFYKCLEFISNNWEWCYTKFAPVSYQNWLSMDLATAIAIEITGFHDAVIDQVCPLEFVHMKPGVQDWSAPTASWQDTVPYVLNSRGELTVGGIRQSKLFHYVEKNFMSKKILSILKEIHNG